MKGVTINGTKLHEVLMPLVRYQNCNSIPSLCYPKSRIFYELLDDGLLKLKLPVKLALEMYRIGILPQDKQCSFPVRISGKPMGNYQVIDFLYPNTDMYHDIVFITLKKR